MKKLTIEHIESLAQTLETIGLKFSPSTPLVQIQNSSYESGATFNIVGSYDIYTWMLSGNRGTINISETNTEFTTSAWTTNPFRVLVFFNTLTKNFGFREGIPAATPSDPVLLDHEIALTYFTIPASGGGAIVTPTPEPSSVVASAVINNSSVTGATVKDALENLEADKANITHAVQHYPTGSDSVNAQSYHGVLARTLVGSNPLPSTITTTTFTLGATANPITYYYKATKVIVNSDKTATLAEGAGFYFVYFDGATGNILATKAFPGISADSNVLIAAIAWNGTDLGLVYDERHSYTRNHDFHLWAHTTVGTRYKSGLTLTQNSGTGTAASFATTAGEIADEDILFAISASSAFPTANACRLWYQNGVNSYTFDKTTSTVPFKRGANNRPFVVKASDATNKELTTATNRFANVFVYATSDLHTPIYMFAESMSDVVYANNGHTSTANARAIPFPNLSGFALSPELKPIYRLIVRADGQLQAINMVQDDYRTVSSLPMAAGTTSTTAAAVSFNPAGNLSSINVQNAIEELDAHTHTPVKYFTETWTMEGELATTRTFIEKKFRIASGTTLKVKQIDCKIKSGTSATIKLQKNGVDLTGFTSISATTAWGNTAPASDASHTLANGDVIVPVCTAVSATPVNVSINVTFEETLTV